MSIFAVAVLVFMAPAGCRSYSTRVDADQELSAIICLSIGFMVAVVLS